MNDATRRCRARWPFVLAGAAAVALLTVSAPGQARQWLRGPGQGSGTPDGVVRAIEPIAGGLVLGGEFNQVGERSMPSLAMWDGWTYSAPPGFQVNGPVYAMTVHQGELIVGGRFTRAGDLAVSNIARWNPATRAWSALPGLMGEGVDGPVLALLSNGQDLYVGGSFAHAAVEQPAQNIALWRRPEQRWTPLNGGVDGAVRALALYREPMSTGPAVFVGGDFVSADNLAVQVAVNRLARWRPGMPYGVWSAVGPALTPGVDRPVRALAVFDEDGPAGVGPSLFVGGEFARAGGAAIRHLARWNGAAWMPMVPLLDAQPDAPVLALRAMAGRLVAGGEFTSIGGGPYLHIAGWDGSAWAAIGSPGRWLDGAVCALAEFNDGGGQDLYAGGLFTGTTSAGRAAYIADLEKTVIGEEWTIPSGGLNGPVAAWAEYQGSLYAAGGFTVAGGRAANYIARWDGFGWQPAGEGLDAPARTLLVHREASGAAPRLFAGGEFTEAGGLAARAIAAWDGIAWSAVGARDGPVNALAEYRSLLFAGGEFDISGGGHLGFWDGEAWTEIGAGLNGPVYALVEADGPVPGLTVLLAGGAFTRAGSESVETPYLARWLWESGGWSAIDGGQPDGVVRALATQRSPDVLPFFYAGGDFVSAGGAVVNRVALWMAGGWIPLADGLTGGPVHALLLREGWLYAAGEFTASGPAPMTRFTRWREGWCIAMEPGLDDAARAIGAYAGDIVVGGRFTHAGGRGSEYWARWGLCAVDYTGDGLVDFGDFLEFLNLYDAADPRADLDADGLVDFTDYLVFLNLYEAGC